ITRPEVVKVFADIGYPGADKFTAVDAQGNAYDPATGGRLTIENPVARQQFATEQAAGLQSGQPGPPTAGSIESGGAAFIAGRLPSRKLPAASAPARRSSS